MQSPSSAAGSSSSVLLGHAVPCCCLWPWARAAVWGLAQPPSPPQPFSLALQDLFFLYWTFFLFLSSRQSLPGPGLQLHLPRLVQSRAWTTDMGSSLLGLWCWIEMFFKPVKYTKLWPLHTLLLDARGDFVFYLFFNKMQQLLGI